MGTFLRYVSIETPYKQLHSNFMESFLFKRVRGKNAVEWASKAERHWRQSETEGRKAEQLWPGKRNLQLLLRFQGFGSFVGWILFGQLRTIFFTLGMTVNTNRHQFCGSWTASLA